MARGINGWTRNDLTLFLKCHNFSFHKELDGSHEVWISGNEQWLVEVNITKKSYPPRTLETMIGNSGLDKKHWKKWTTLSSRDKKKARCCG